MWNQLNFVMEQDLLCVVRSMGWSVVKVQEKSSSDTPIWSAPLVSLDKSFHNGDELFPADSPVGVLIVNDAFGVKKRDQEHFACGSGVDCFDGAGCL